MQFENIIVFKSNLNVFKKHYIWQTFDIEVQVT